MIAFLLPAKLERPAFLIACKAPATVSNSPRAFVSPSTNHLTALPEAGWGLG
jgi:hypothetical protein